MNESALFPGLLRIQDNEMYGSVEDTSRGTRAEERRNEEIRATRIRAAFKRYRRYRVNVYVCICVC